MLTRIPLSSPHCGKAPCLIKVGGVILFDEFAQSALLTQPAILSKLLLMLMYAFLNALGVKVWLGRERSKEEFVREAKKTRGNLTEACIPITSALYRVALFVLYSICLNSVGEYAGLLGLLLTSGLSLYVAVTGGLSGVVLTLYPLIKAKAAGCLPAFIGNNSKQQRTGTDLQGRDGAPSSQAPSSQPPIGDIGLEEQENLAKYALIALLTLPAVPNIVYVPLGLLYLGFAQLTLLLGRMASDHIIASKPKDAVRPDKAAPPAQEAAKSIKLAALLAKVEANQELASKLEVDAATLGEMRHELERGKESSQPAASEKGSTDSLVWDCTCLPDCLHERVPEWANGSAAPAKTAIGWIRPIFSLKQSNGMAMVQQAVPYGETSVVTLAGGMASLVTSIALSQLVAYGSWAATDTSLMGDVQVNGTVVHAFRGQLDVQTTIVHALKMNLWVMWCALGVHVVFICILPFLRANSQMQGLIGAERWKRVVSCVLVALCILFVSLLPITIVLWLLDEVFLISIFAHLQTCYANSFAAIYTLHLAWPSLLPLAEVLELFDDPTAAFQELLDSLASIAHYIDFDPAYFAQNILALGALNVVLNLLKVLAAVGAKMFDLFDVLQALFRKQAVALSDQRTLQVHKCLADPKRAEADVALGLLCQRLGTTLEDVLVARTLDWNGRQRQIFADFHVADVLSVVHLLHENGSLTEVR